MFKSHKINLKHRVPKKNKVYTYRTLVFAPDHSATVLPAQMCTNSNEHYIFIRFLWLVPYYTLS
jgi:hypothetical protein